VREYPSPIQRESGRHPGIDRGVASTVTAALAALTGATYDVDGGQHFVEQGGET